MDATPSKKRPPPVTAPRLLFVRGQSIRLPPDEGPRFILPIGDDDLSLAPHSSDGVFDRVPPSGEGQSFGSPHEGTRSRKKRRADV
jgi:hypothetical protein